MTDPNNTTMDPPPYSTGPVPHPPPPEPKHFPPDILPIYILKVERNAAEMMAEMAADATPPEPQPMQLANVDDPTSPPLRNNTTPSAGAFTPTSAVIEPPPPPPTDE
jgi:hypothetical protein